LNFVGISRRTKPGDKSFIFDNGVVLNEAQCQKSFGDWHLSILEFANSLHAIDIDLSAFACLSALTLITGN
jgi:nuclear receptor subfamily 4 group A member 2